MAQRYASVAQQRYMNAQARRGMADSAQVAAMNLATKPLGGYKRLNQYQDNASAMQAPMLGRRKKK